MQEFKPEIPDVVVDYVKTFELTNESCYAGIVCVEDATTIHTIVQLWLQNLHFFGGRVQGEPTCGPFLSRESLRRHRLAPARANRPKSAAPTIFTLSAKKPLKTNPAAVLFEVTKGLIYRRIRDRWFLIFEWRFFRRRLWRFRPGRRLFRTHCVPNPSRNYG